jgi:acyl-CoA synthetase (AMP-forming)/AMP-acid ligase II
MIMNGGVGLSSADMATLVDIPRYHVARTPDATALVHNGRETRYVDLDRLSNRVANGLAAFGIGAKSRVAILDKNSDLFFQILFGAAKINAVLVPINARLAPPEILFALNDAQAEVIFVGQPFVQVIEAICHQLTSIRKVIVLATDFAAWRDGQDATDPAVAVDIDDVVLQLYTSGTTGYPKGVQLTHRNFTSQARDECRAWSPDEVMLLTLPLFHIAGCGMGIHGLLSGLKIIIAREFVASEILQMIERDRVTVAFLVPAMLLALVAERRVEQHDLSSLKQILYGASPIPLELLKRALSVFKYSGFFQVYGLTETTGIITILRSQDHFSARTEIMKSCGRAVAGVEVRVIDDKGMPVGANRVGEIICRSSQNMKGYWRRPQDTAVTIRDQWLFTGDAGYLDDEGYLYIQDRIKDMIVSGGENVYPAEIESALFGHPDIADVAVIGVPDEKWGEAVKALLVLKEGRVADDAGILQYARERLAGYKVPKTVEFVDELPRNPSGKILKRALREQYWKGYERRVN